MTNAQSALKRSVIRAVSRAGLKCVIVLKNAVFSIHTALESSTENLIKATNSVRKRVALVNYYYSCRWRFESAQSQNILAHCQFVSSPMAPHLHLFTFQNILIDQ